MSDDELAIRAASQLAAIGEQLENAADGSFEIPDAEFGGGSDKDRLLTWLMANLSRRYPQFEWKRSYNLFEPGVVVSWRRYDGKPHES